MAVGLSIFNTLTKFMNVGAIQGETCSKIGIVVLSKQQIVPALRRSRLSAQPPLLLPQLLARYGWALNSKQLGSTTGADLT
jgi:hypothetical protein